MPVDKFKIDLSPTAKSFVIGMYLGAIFGVLFCVFDMYGR